MQNLTELQRYWMNLVSISAHDYSLHAIEYMCYFTLRNKSSHSNFKFVTDHGKLQIHA